MDEMNETFAPNGENAADDGALVVEIINSANGVSGKYDIFPEDTLSEIVEVVRVPLGLGSAQDLNVEYNGDTTATLSKTVAEMNVVNGSKIIIHPNAKVA